MNFFNKMRLERKIIAFNDIDDNQFDEIVNLAAIIEISLKMRYATKFRQLKSQIEYYRFGQIVGNEEKFKESIKKLILEIQEILKK